MKALLPIVLAFVAPLELLAEDPAAEEEKPEPGHSHVGDSFDEGPRQAGRKMDGTGDVHFPITCEWSRGQAMFDQGIGQLHGFWYYEAERTFRQIAAEDRDCAMAYWGMAMANWGNSKRAKGFIEEAEKAMQRRPEISEREKLWIEAQAAFLGNEPNDIKERRKKLILAMENIIHEYPDDPEVKAFLVVRLWQLSRQGIEIGSRQAVDALLDQVFDANPRHPAHHYRIHLWDGKKTERALDSAAVLHSTAPTIAHMWHMPGHIYDKLKRYPESAYHQEASARVDHRTQAENGVLPDTIHNYAHNNEWLIRNWSHVGRVDDAIAFAKGMVDNPMHPKLNHYGKGNASVSYGRKRLLEVLERFERWEELIALADTHYLEPTDQKRLQTDRLLRLGRAHFGLGHEAELGSLIADFDGQISELEAEKERKENEAREKAEAEEKDEKETEKMVKDAGRDSENRLKELRVACDELVAYRELMAGEPLDEERAKKIKREKSALALLHLECGEGAKAVELANKAVEERPKRVVPLAIQAHVLKQTDDEDGAAKALEALSEISGQVQADARPFVRLGDPATWKRNEAPYGEDFGDKPANLDHLGPLVYQAPKAPAFEVRAEDGGACSLADFEGKPVVLLYYLGHSCSHCVEQLNAFTPLTEKFREAGIELLAISSEPHEELSKAHELCESEEKRFPFPLCSDPDATAFKAYGAFDDFENMALHGVFLVDGEGRLRWMDVGPDPYMKAEFLLEESRRLLGM